MPKADVKDIKDLPEILTVDQVARLFGVNRNRIYEEIHAKRIPHFLFGRSIRIPRRAIERMLEDT